jgi:hypothetical protein
LESDYSLLLSESSLLNWGKEDFNVLGMEFFMRKLNLLTSSLKKVRFYN